MIEKLENDNMGKFIIIEGIDGAGKTTLIAKLSDYLSSENISHIVVCGAKETNFAKNILELLLEAEKKEPVDPCISSLLFMAMEKDVYNKVIKPALNKGMWVICDRFFDSTLIYHGFAEKNKEIIHNFKGLLDFTFKKVIPDLTFILDISPEIAKSRLRKRSELNVYDYKGLDYKKNMRQGYLKIAKEHQDKYKIINANQKLNEIMNEVTECIFQKYINVSERK
ncbi:MAG: dTMP kinase [Alphaproteobacteria bacterium]|nr:dTMP kinase [Alphaproteobacteria bacterium]MBQ3117482.1 dTMP kinase [Alphaproteobacteria bacterium]MBQ6854401.1 dTMP kinase [Alphaproteobacteria bacterium]